MYLKYMYTPIFWTFRSSKHVYDKIIITFFGTDMSLKGGSETRVRAEKGSLRNEHNSEKGGLI